MAAEVDEVQLVLDFLTVELVLYSSWKLSWWTAREFTGGNGNSGGGN